MKFLARGHLATMGLAMFGMLWIQLPEGWKLEAKEPPDLPFDRPMLGDMDGDGYRSDRLRFGDDCDDTDPTIYPGAIEVCDGLDQNCNGAVDEGAGDLLYPDEDADGWGASGQGIKQCIPAEGYIARGDDCNDHDPVVHPESLELMDRTDQDCDGTVDETSLMSSLETEDASSAPRILGDINGDGFDDFVLLKATSSIYLGGSQLEAVLDETAVRFEATICGGHLGGFVRLGDLNDDGFDDFGYLCQSASDYQMNFLNIYAGRAVMEGFDLSQISSSIVSPAPDQVLTTVARYAGDLDDDGYEDLLLGLSGDSATAPMAGKVAILYGGPTWWPMYTSAAAGDITIQGREEQGLGAMVENIGDLDSDGHDEIAVIEHPSSGRERLNIFSNLQASEGNLDADDSAATLYSANFDEGLHVGYVGDVSGDGTDDLMVSDGYSLHVMLDDDGAWYLTGAMLTLDGASDYRLDFAAWSQNTTHTLEFFHAGDVNDDGRPDVVVGSWAYEAPEESAAGDVWLILGVPALVSGSDWPTPSASAGTCTGDECLAGARGTFSGNGDIDGDDHADIVFTGDEDHVRLVPGY